MKSIIIIRLGRLGDVTLTGPTIKNLRFLYPDSKITFVTRQKYKPLVQLLSGVDDVLCFPDNGPYFDLVKLSSIVDEKEPNLVVDLHKNFRSFHLAKLSKAPYKVVYKKRRKERRAAVTEKKFVSPVPHTVDLYNRIMEKLKGDAPARRPHLMLPEDILWDVGFNREGISMVPGASSKVKAWDVERFSELAERIIADFKIPVGIFLGEDEADLQNYFSHLPREMVAIHNNLPLPEIAPLISQSRLTITNDSGLMHVSSAVGTPTVAFFGPTHEQLGFYPLGLHDIILSMEEKCRPCSLHGDEPCYREEQYCFTRLTVDSAYDKIAEMIDRIRLRPAVFIDRDGTLIEDKHYLADPGKIAFLPGSIEAVRKLKEAGYKIVIVSNQSGVARGFYPVETVDLVHRRMVEIMQKAGGEPDDIRFCPHHPDGDDPKYTGDCSCRKPKSGMLEEAVVHLGIDIRRSYMIGDKMSDIRCGVVAGCESILARTGKGADSEKSLCDDNYLNPRMICDNLAAAAEFILNRK